MKEWKKIWYRDRFFLMFLAAAFIIALMLCHAAIEKRTEQDIESAQEDLQYWQEMRLIKLGVSDDLMHITKVEMIQGGVMESSIDFVDWFLLVFYETDFYYIMAAFAFTAVFLGKWILENSGRKKEFVSLLPVRSRNVWIAEFLEGFVPAAVFGCFYIGDCCVQQMRITQACKEVCAEIAMLKATANLDRVILQSGKLLLLILMVYATFYLTKELVNVPALLIVIIPFTYFSPTILEVSWYMLTSTEGDIDWGSLLGPRWIILGILFFVTSYILHTKKDVSSTKVFRFMAAEIVYLFLTLCFFFCLFSGGMEDWKANSLFKNILSFVLSGAVTFAVWLLAERKTASMFLPQKQSL